MNAPMKMMAATMMTEMATGLRYMQPTSLRGNLNGRVLARRNLQPEFPLWGESYRAWVPKPITPEDTEGHRGIHEGEAGASAFHPADGQIGLEEQRDRQARRAG